VVDGQGNIDNTKLDELDRFADNYSKFLLESVVVKNVLLHKEDGVTAHHVLLAMLESSGSTLHPQNLFKAKNQTVTNETNFDNLHAIESLKYLTQVCILNQVSLCASKASMRSSEQKIYPCDPLFFFCLGAKRSSKTAAAMESIVFNKLTHLQNSNNSFGCNLGEPIMSFRHEKMKDVECDFLVGDDTRRGIQISMNLSKITTAKRELQGLLGGLISENINEGLILVHQNSTDYEALETLMSDFLSDTGEIKTIRLHNKDLLRANEDFKTVSQVTLQILGFVKDQKIQEEIEINSKHLV